MTQLSKITDYLSHALPQSNYLTYRRLQVRKSDITDTNRAAAKIVPERTENTTFIPPPNTDITPALIQQSLSQQPQTLGQISSVQPFFRDGVIRFTMNLVGSVGSTGMLLNASTRIIASTIGDNDGPSLVIVPQSVTNGAEMVTTNFATIMAVNMYSKDYLTFWVTLNNGTMVGLLSDTKVHDIDRIDPTTSTVSVMPSSLTGKKRGIGIASAMALQKEADDITTRATSQAQGPNGATKRGIESVNAYNAKMTQEACEAMECTINDEDPLWNMFTRACYCETSQSYWTVNPSADTAG